ncbi:glycosyltransferase family 4 protein [Plantactinospora sp. KLBMP9567]|uniref:glycosyltransferase family 4 protein n=1 Tax=Plantactinospora sp. KLBMP9567 TaxID=3085900 RepID=UPI0029829CBA|nr:glycosyltransferase family 4 protein [Plantactinospora sp. KLBMP9567]MDW5330629.1 glycosyltransferase family 4 protein [Plantactinospora sp. KLBMP9567]
MRAIVQTVDTVSDDVDLTVVTRDCDVGSAEVYRDLSGKWWGRRRSRIFYLDVRRPLQWLGLWRELRRTKFDLLHVNSLWEPLFTVLPIVAVRLGLVNARRVLLSPHGELSPGALMLKGRKKRLFLTVWAPLLRHADVTWHAVTNREAAEIRAVFPWAKILVNHYQVPLPEEPLPPQAPSDGPVRLVFLGRISPKKNLDMVLDALNRVSSPVELDIYGPLEDVAHWSRCEQLISRLPLNVTVRYQGEVAPSAVRQIFSRYDAFVFPTLGENFGFVIAESLSASCPVICSDETPWSDVLHDGGGRVLDELAPADLAKELDRFAAMTPRERLDARERAGDAYRAWRQAVGNDNLLDRVRTAGLIPSGAGV